MKRLLLVAGAFLLAGSASGQSTYYSAFSYTGFIPKVGINTRAATLQQAILPQVYADRSAFGDLRWVEDNDSALTAFWDANSDEVLHILTELSGLEWHEAEFDIYLVRNAPSIGSGEPVIVPFGGIIENGLTAAVPTDHRLKLNLLYQLSQRMLAQATQPGSSASATVASHPLLRPTPFRRDILAMLLAIHTARAVMGIDSTEAAWNSAFWQHRFPGREILEVYFLKKWTLTPKEPLTIWINRESYSSDVVRATRPPRQADEDYSRPRRLFVEGLPLKGDLGLSVSLDDENRLVVDRIDASRLAYANGVRPGDVIRRIGGSLVRTQKAMIEKLLEVLDRSGASTIEIIRDGRTQTLAFQRITLPYWDDPELDTIPTDSIPKDTIPPDTLEPNELGTPR